MICCWPPMRDAPLIGVKLHCVQMFRWGAWGTGEKSMKAIVRETYGSPDVLELRDIDCPEIEDDEALIRVQAAGVDRGVWHLLTGLPYPIRLAGYGLRSPKNPVIGSDLAGGRGGGRHGREQVPAWR